MRATQVGPGQSPAFSTSINGYGGIKVLVETDPPPRFNGEMMRGFGLLFDGVDRFATTESVGLGGVTISRAVYVNRSANWARWLDTFTNGTTDPLTVKVAFGGQSGIGASGGNSSTLVNTSSGDAVVTEADAWVEVATPLSGATLVGAPQIVVIGTPGTPESPFAGAMTFAGNWLYESFDNPITYSGHEGNFQAYVNTLTLAPGESKSLLHFLVLGPRVNTTTSADVRAAVEATASSLVTAPAISDLATAEICSIANFNIAGLAIPGFDIASCVGTIVVAQPPVPDPTLPVTTSPYDVVGKTIAELRADMESGVTTSQEITRAYLDRIAVYDLDQFGFNAFEVLATDAMEQAAAADAARAGGTTGPLLGIPIGIKNLFDTYDMPTTNGSFTFEGFLPAQDAFQVAKLREAGAVLIGKSALASSGGSATAVATSMCAAALGSQTGDSLYAPASGASLVTLRGTDGLQSGTGVMPLSWLTDFGGAMTRSVSDLADMLNILAGTDPDDPMTAPADAMIPADWRTVLDINALQGKRIGFIPALWVDPFLTTGTTDASIAALQYLVQAGATIVEMGTTVGGTNTPTAPPDSTTGNTTQEGWMQYIDSHPELVTQGFQIFSAVDVSCSQKKVAYVRQDPSACAVAPAARMTQAEIDAKRAQRVLRQGAAKTWMDTAGADGLGVDAVVYPGLLSDISLNDGGGGRASFGRRDTPGAANGIPTVVFPAGYNDHGQPIDIQLLGRAWDDDKLVGMAFAFEHYANLAGNGKVETVTVPALQFEPTPTPTPTPTSVPVEGVYVQINDGSKPDRDSYTIRGSVTVAPGSDPLADALVTGVTVAVYETSSGQPLQVSRVTFGTSQCRTVRGESLSLVCKDRISGSSLRMRGKAAKPGIFSLNTTIKRRDFTPGKPFAVPLWGGLQIGAQSWLGKTTASSCTVSSGGERTTCK